MLVANEAGLASSAPSPRARIAAMALAGDDPVIMLTAPIPATRKLPGARGHAIDQVDRYEVNEAFAVGAAARGCTSTGADPAKVNVNGGAIALGHPLGCTGAKLHDHAAARARAHRAAATGCRRCARAAASANATLIERA